MNELSLQGQYHTQDDFRKAILNIIEIFNTLDQRKLASDYYKDSLFVNREGLAKRNFVESFETLSIGKGIDVKNLFRRTWLNGLSVVDWRSDQLHSTNDLYECDCFQGSVTDFSIAEAGERKFRQQDLERCLINFADSTFGASVIVHKNNARITELIGFSTLAELNKKFPTPVVPLDHFLHDTLRFVKTNRNVHGKIVYKEKSLQRFWYLDNLHRDHFEVFDFDGNHLGEASLSGVLDDTKVDSNKKFRY